MEKDSGERIYDYGRSKRIRNGKAEGRRKKLKDHRKEEKRMRTGNSQNTINIKDKEINNYDDETRSAKILKIRCSGEEHVGG